MVIIRTNIDKAPTKYNALRLYSCGKNLKESQLNVQFNKDTHKMANTHLFTDAIFLMTFTVIWCRLLISGSECPNFACSA